MFDIVKEFFPQCFRNSWCRYILLIIIVLGSAVVYLGYDKTIKKVIRLNFEKIYPISTCDNGDIYIHGEFYLPINYSMDFPYKDIFALGDDSGCKAKISKITQKIKGVYSYSMFPQDCIANEKMKFYLNERSISKNYFMEAEICDSVANFSFKSLEVN